MKDDWIVGCMTPVKGRQLALRSCIMQMLLQTRPPDVHALFFNGADEMCHDRKLINDLIDSRHPVVHRREDMSILAAHGCALDMLLETNVNLFFKIDSDDVYKRRYIEAIIERLPEYGFTPDSPPFCINLIDQLWVDVKSFDQVESSSFSFDNGLGLLPEEREKGMVVGAPPTYVFNRSAARLLSKWQDYPAYSKDKHADRAWRNILFDNGVTITKIPTPYCTVFGYVRHDSNYCVLRK